MAGAEAGAGVAVEVLVERARDRASADRVWNSVVVAEDRPPARSRRAGRCAISRRESSSATSSQRQHLARAGRALDLEVVAEIVVELLQRLDQQEVDREPDRAAPVRVAAEEAGRRLAPARSRRGARCRRRVSDVRAARVIRATARGCRTARGTRSRRACSCSTRRSRCRPDDGEQPALAAAAASSCARRAASDRAGAR